MLLSYYYWHSSLKVLSVKLCKLKNISNYWVNRVSEVLGKAKLRLSSFTSFSIASSSCSLFEDVTCLIHPESLPSAMSTT